jgi:membrane protein required for colicin V production
MTPLIFDLIIVALLILSVGLGFMRGFCNEVFTLVGWIGAVIATIYFTPVLREFGRDLIDKKWLADLATSSAIFIVTLGIFSGVSYFVTKGIHMTRLGIVDRSLGFGFGLLRGVVMAGLCFLLFAYVFEPEDRPDFVKDARTRPFLEASARWMQAILPSDAGDVRISDEDEDPLDKAINGKEHVEPKEDEAEEDKPAMTEMPDQEKDPIAAIQEKLEKAQ